MLKKKISIQIKGFHRNYKEDKDLRKEIYKKN